MTIQGHKIGQLAKLVDVPVSTIRYYERRGLLSPDARSSGNYRIYGDESVEMLAFVKSAQIAGFTLKDIESLLAIRNGNAEPCCAVQNIVKARIKRVDEELDHLKEVDGLLRRWLSACEHAERAGHCPVLDGMIGSRESDCGEQM